MIWSFAKPQKKILFLQTSKYIDIWKSDIPTFGKTQKENIPYFLFFMLPPFTYNRDHQPVPLEFFRLFYTSIIDANDSTFFMFILPMPKQNGFAMENTKTISWPLFYRIFIWLHIASSKTGKSLFTMSLPWPTYLLDYLIVGFVSRVIFNY